MGDVVSDGGFNSGTLAAWSLDSAGGYPQITAGDKYEGTHACVLYTLYTTFGPTRHTTSVAQAFSTGIGERIEIRCRVKSATGAPLTADAEFFVTVDTGNGIPATAVVLAGDDMSGGYDLVSWSGISTGTVCSVTFGMRNTYTSNVTSYAVLDAVVISVSGATTRIRDALFADLSSITVENGYSTDIVTVSKTAVSEATVAKPALVITPREGGTSDRETMTDRQGQRWQRFNVRLIVKGDDAHMLLYDLLDDVSNALEPKTSGTGSAIRSGAWAVDNCMVIDWVVEGADPATQTQQTLALDATIEVWFNYLRGSL